MQEGGGGDSAFSGSSPSGGRSHDTPKDVCFVCGGHGHWARECTSLPATYLRDNAPHCYNCAGIGHFARFCPNVLFGRQSAVYFEDGGGSWYSPIWYPPVGTPTYSLLPSTLIYATNGQGEGEETQPLLSSPETIPRSEMTIVEDVNSCEIILEHPIIDGNKAH